MLRIRSLGASEILCAGERIGPEQPLAFALIILLAMRDSSPSPRRELAALLWPAAADPERNHRLRSLLHRLRRLGIPLQCSSATVLIRGASFDFHEFSHRATSIEMIRERIARVGPVLPGVVSSASPLADRLDDERDIIIATLTRWLTAALDVAKEAGDWPLVERIARAAIEVDPASDAAWLWLAESQCVTAGRDMALTTLETLIARVGSRDDCFPTHALLLRQRILDVTSPVVDASFAPLVGRDDIMRRLWSAVARATAGRGGAILLWGPAGIGKTRVLDEVDRARPIPSARIVRLHARPVHALRPVSLIIDLATRLLGEPGAVGCDPAAFATLQRCANQRRPNDATSTRSIVTDDVLFDALVELLAALSDENPLVIAIDDLQLCDPAVWRFLGAIARWSSSRRLLWLFCHRALRDAEISHVPEPSLIQRLLLRCLDHASALALLAAISTDSSERDRERLHDMGGGHPGLLNELARSGSALSTPIESIVDDTVVRLSQHALQALRLIATLGGRATPRSLADHDIVARAQLGAALGELARAGMIREHDGVLYAHTIWAEAALAALAPSERLAIDID